MKHVFLIGDSIREGFCETVKNDLRDAAVVAYPAENCQFTQYTYVHLNDWAHAGGNPADVDLVYWNNGHWDMARWIPCGKNEEPLNPPVEYASMLKRLIPRIRAVFPNAKIVFYTTPHVEDGVKMIHPRSNADIEQYNAAALAVMAEVGIPVSHLCAFCDTLTDKPKYADGIHFTPECFEKLGHFVSNEIRAFLSE